MSNTISTHDEEKLQQGLALLHSAHYWKAHEEWEQLWLSCPDPSGARQATKALIQMAAICYKPEQAAQGRAEADMQKGMMKLLITARRHLSESFERCAPQPRWRRPSLQEALDDLQVVVDDWRSGTLLHLVRERVWDIARCFDPTAQSSPPQDL